MSTTTSTSTTMTQTQPQPQQLKFSATAEDPMAHMHETVTNHMQQFDPSHDMHHVNRVVRTAKVLARKVAETQPVDQKVVEVAALLHDVNDSKYRDQLNNGEDVLLKCLKESDLTQEQQDLVVKIAHNMSYSTEKKLREAGQWGKWHDECVELHIVQDADRLDAIGAMGILRLAAYSGAKNRPLVLTGDEDDEDTMWHFGSKLLHMHKKMKTVPGREVALKRTGIMQDMVTNAFDEVTLADLGEKTPETDAIGETVKERWIM
ncbi:hypothetical protein CJU89_3867 [Yarrowia sp. B02]|nr:hypothetical protein CJU89_3867 [Yarrowia sp. B02]